MRFYENPQKTSENRLPQRAYYIPENEGAYTLLNGDWRFRYYARDIDLPKPSPSGTPLMCLPAGNPVVTKIPIIPTKNILSR